MTQMLTLLKKSGRAALVALTLGAATVTAMPAQAQSSPSFNFSFGINGGGDNFSFGWNNGRQIRRACLSDSEVRRGLQRNGFSNVRFLDRRGIRIRVMAEHRRDTYRMSINRCTGRVTDIERVRDRYWDRGRPGRPGFGLHLDFGN